jgi:hypothetical protein
MRPCAGADSEVKLRASSPQQCTYTCTLQAPALLVILLACHRIHRRNKCDPPGE